MYESEISCVIIMIQMKIKTLEIVVFVKIIKRGRKLEK